MPYTTKKLLATTTTDKGAAVIGRHGLDLMELDEQQGHLHGNCTCSVPYTTNTLLATTTTDMGAAVIGLDWPENQQCRIPYSSMATREEICVYIRRSERGGDGREEGRG